MKRFTEYINESNEQFISEGFLSSLTKFFGGMIGNASAGIKNFTKEVQGLPEKTRLMYKITMQSILDITDNAEKKAVQKLIDSYDSCKNADDIVLKNYEYLSQNKFPKSKFNTGLIGISNSLASNSSNAEVKSKMEEFKNMMAEQDETAKVELKKEIDNGNETKKEETPTNQETPEPEKKTEKEVKNVTETDPIDALSNKANLDNKKLQNAIYQMLLNKEGEIKWDINNANDVMTGLSAIICGGMIIKNEEVYSKILAACGIKFGKDFITSITKKTEE